jgi:hypothetical protein
MSIIELYSKRKSAIKDKGIELVFQYDELPQKLRIQIVHIWKSTIGVPHLGDGWMRGPNEAHAVWQFIRDVICREHGLFKLTKNVTVNSFDECVRYLLESKADNCLDIIEISFRVVAGPKIAGYTNEDWRKNEITQRPDDAIEELNCRFKENNVGYQFIEDNIIRIDSLYSYKEIIEPAINLLTLNGFEGASEEFLLAHKKYKENDFKGGIAECLKAFESTIITIGTKLKWQIPSKPTAKVLIEECFKNELIPKYLQSHFDSLRNMLESGIPTVRNKTSGHGQGVHRIDIPEYYVSYALNITATNIILLTKAFQDI